MHLTPHLPDVAFARVLGAGGPYRVDDVVTIAFTAPGVCRLAAHRRDAFEPLPQASVPIVPEAITVEVTMSAGPYGCGDRLMLSFVDPSVARMHVIFGRHEHDRPASTEASPAPDGDPLPEDDLTRATLEALQSNDRSFSTYSEADLAFDWARIERELETESGNVLHATGVIAVSDSGASPLRGVRVKLGWDSERTRRFVQVVDKLFAVDRLGWYRHVLAVRLLLPDEIATGDGPADVDAGQQLQALRVAAAQALGRPLLAACMPNFSVTPEWLDELDSVGAARAIAGLRDAILPHVNDDPAVQIMEPPARCTVGVITRRDLLATPPANVEALLPVLMPYGSHVPKLTEKLYEYRCALIEVFGQTANSAEAVRLNAMSQTNHALDDRLWQLVGTIGESFGGLAVA
ncbi:MAG: hypothetical protein IAI50_11670 [Candidatus Eremiobacteraeota bacterium]|nr:hypothetical protein [Candidatus Eremiobacteraeota bacterium]